MRRVFLFIAILVASLIALELALRGGSLLLEAAQEEGNKSEGDYVILALGESTTAAGGENSWPSQLERILNEKDLEMEFSVINKGMHSSNSSLILSDLDKNLDKYNPDMVISMIGINDEYGPAMFSEGWVVSEAGSGFNGLVKSLRIYKVFRYLQSQVADLSETGGSEGKQATKEEELLREIEKNPEDPNLYSLLGKVYFATERLDEAEENFIRAIEFDRGNEVALLHLGLIRVGEERYEEAEQLYKKAIEENKESANGYIHLGDIYTNYFETEPSPVTDFEKAEKMFKKAIEVDPNNESAYLRLAKFYRQKKELGKAEEIYKELIERQKGSLAAHMELGDLYSFLGEEDKALDMHTKARELKPSLKTNHLLIKEKIVKRGIEFVAVQYPMRSLEPLKIILGASDGSVEEIVFVENEKVFKEAVEEEGYDTYFIDRFASDFGHATPKGNRLLAENIADTIIREVFRK